MAMQQEVEPNNDHDSNDDGVTEDFVFAMSPPQQSDPIEKRRATVVWPYSGGRVGGVSEVEIVNEASDLEDTDFVRHLPPRSVSCHGQLSGGSALDKSQQESKEQPASAAMSKPHLDDFSLISVVGRGAYGKVFLVQKKDSGDYYAMKVIKKADIVKHNVVRHAKAERSVLVAARHPFIVQLRFAFQTPSKLYLILDFIRGGELFTRLNAVQFFMLETAVFYAAELVLALGHLHQQEILYRDLKPENVMLQADGHICLTDMGLAKHDADKDGTRSFCGTVAYMAPEVIRKADYGKTADWWSLGALLYEMMSGHVPFEARNQAKLQQKILNAKLHFPRHFNNCSKNILRRLLQRNPERRLGANGAAEVMSHAFFANVRWDALENKQIPAPHVPELNSGVDVSVFEDSFTNEPPIDSATDSDTTPLSESMQQHFAGFSFQ